MRTTVNIDDRLLDAARARARTRGQSLGDVVNDALRRELAARDSRPGPTIPFLDGAGGLRPGIDPTSNRSLREALDEGQSLEQLR